MKFIYLIFLIFLSSNAQSRVMIDKSDIMACSKYVNLQRAGWQKQRNIPNLDQGPVGLCYAHAAVTLLDLWRDIHGLKITKEIALSSPHYAALLYKMEKDTTNIEKKTLDSGFGNVTLNIVKKYGMCRSDIIDFSMEKFSRENKVSPRDWYAVTEWFLEFYNPSIEKEIAMAPDKAEKLKEIFSRYTERDDVKEIYKNGDFLKIYEGLKPYLLNRDYKGYVKNVFDLCFKKENIYLSTQNLPQIITLYKAPKFTKTIIGNLDKKNPVAISYSHKILKEGDGRLKKVKYFFSQVDHESVLIGKRVRGGKCQFLLKNTWGNYCQYPSWECQKSPEGLEIGVWIDAEYLLSALKGMYFFDNSK
jgi:hypothetical protein